MRLVWTGLAVEDLRSALAYLAEDSPNASARQAALILAAIARLMDFPEQGRPGRWTGTRELVVPKTPYVVPYRQRGDGIEILRILHGRRSWPRNA